MPRPELLQFAIDVGNHALEMVDATVQEVRDAIRPPPRGPRGFTRASTEQFSGLPPSQLVPPGTAREGPQHRAYDPGGGPPSPPTRRPLSARSPAQMAAANGWSAVENMRGTAPPPGLRLTRNAHDMQLAQQASAREQNPSEYHEDDLALAISLSERQSPQWQGPRLDRDPSIRRGRSPLRGETTNMNASHADLNDGLSDEEALLQAIRNSGGEAPAVDDAHLDLNDGLSDDAALLQAIRNSGGEAPAVDAHVDLNDGLSDEAALQQALDNSNGKRPSHGAETRGRPRSSDLQRIEAIEKRQAETLGRQLELSARQTELQKNDQSFQLAMKQVDLAKQEMDLMTAGTKNLVALAKDAL